MNPRPLSLMYIAAFLGLATLTGCGAVLIRARMAPTM